MKKLSVILLALLMLAALPVTALASNEYYEEGILVHNPDELEGALVDPSDDILIAADFDWGTGDKILIIDKYGNEKTDYGRDVPDIKLMGSWTIPEDWTVICYETLYFSSEAYMCTVAVDGSFSFMANGSFSTQSYYDHQLVVNGYMATSPNNQTNLSDFSTMTINGHFENPYRCTLGVVTVNSGAAMTIGNTLVSYGLILPDGIHLDGDISLYGDITVNGSAAIDGSVQIFKDVTLSGNLKLDRVQITSSSTTDNNIITIPSGSKVYIGQLIYVDGHQINVGGELTFGGKSQSFENSILQLEGGTVVMEPWIQFSGADKASSITGSGTLKLYAEYRSDFDTYNGYPRLFGLDADQSISDCVDSGVTIWCNWSDCVHTWEENGTVVAPDCSNQGYTLRACTNCGSETMSDYVDPTGEHVLSYAPNQYSENVIDVSCTGCGVTNQVAIFAEPPQVEFEDEPVKVAHVYCSGSLIAEEDLPEIMYINNDQIGTATAFVELGGISISCTFEVVGCVHNVGTPATCQTAAVCGKCGESYGDLADHAWADTISRNDSIHYYECTNEGCDAITSEEEMYGILPPELLEEWEILRYMNNLQDITILDHVYADEASEAAGDCLICGVASAAGDLNGDSTVDDGDVAQLLWHTLFPEAYEISGKADFNGDGKVDDADVAYLLWHTLFPDAYPLN